MIQPESIRVLENCRADTLPLSELIEQAQPVVLRGIVRDWELVQRAQNSADSAMAYMQGFDNGRSVQYSYGGPEVRSRPFYRDGFVDLDCDIRTGPLAQVFEAIRAHAEDQLPPTFYVASLLIDSVLPGLREHNDLGLRKHGIDPAPTIWIGNRVIASCHYDAPNNLACCAVGRRRFTLFAPSQIANLYPGPLEPTPGGQAISLVDFANPDFEQYPRFRDALAYAQTAVLEPGDGIFIPSMWWHQVEGLDEFNVLINYWWSTTPNYLPTPMHALYHALWAIRDRPEHEKQAWREVFDYYVFGPAERAGAHLPGPARGVLGPIDETLARRLRALLINKLNR